MSKKWVYMPVHPKFHKKMKITAAQRSKSIISLSKEMADCDEDIFDVKGWKYQKKQNKFSFGL